MKLIAISGKRRSGKSTLGEALRLRYGYSPISLAEPLKRMVREHFGLTEDQTDGHLKEIVDIRYGKTPRQIMIEMGKFYRSIDQDFWTKKLFEQIKNHPQAQLGVYVVTDVRFANEMEWMKRHQALAVRLERDEYLTGKNIEDESETALDTYTDWDVAVPKEQNVDMTDIERTAETINAHITARA